MSAAVAATCQPSNLFPTHNTAARHTQSWLPLRATERSERYKAWRRHHQQIITSDVEILTTVLSDSCGGMRNNFQFCAESSAATGIE